MQSIQIAEISIEVVLKDIKNIHLSVYPPNGRVKIAAPLRFDLDNIRTYAISKIGWIRQQQKKQRSQKRETSREFITGESHFCLGKRYLLKVEEKQESPKVILRHSTIKLIVRPLTPLEKRREVFEEWQRGVLKEKVKTYITKWEHILDVRVADFGVKKMKTKWGTCNPDASRIWLNLELVKKPLACIEYIVVHEMMHLLERTHNNRYIALMDFHLPHWKLHREELNRLPIGHTDWGSVE